MFMFNINGSGQNKNRYVIGYLLWRVMTGRHDVIEYMMQVPGHARCLVDSGFASIKKLFRRSDCDALDQFETVVNSRQQPTSLCAIRPGKGETGARSWSPVSER